jgi:hypothetical protein
VAVQVFNNNPGNGVDEVAITVVMNGNKYTMPSPVGRTDLIVKGGDLDSEGQVAINAIIAATALSYPGNVTCPTAMAACLTTSLYGAGIKTDSYPPLAATSPSDTQNVVTGRDITKPLPSSAGVSVDDSQPFPIYGSITAQWA